MSSVDQAETVVGNEGIFIFPSADNLETANTTGDLLVAWLGFDLLDPLELSFLEPVTNGELFVFWFRSRLPAKHCATFSEIRLLERPETELPTEFYPEEDVPGFAPLEALFHGGVLIPSRQCEPLP